ncbi:hypothetical protein Tco_0532019 [Tanacetum coccineum]
MVDGDKPPKNKEVTSSSRRGAQIYKVWKAAITIAIYTKNKLGVINETLKRPEEEGFLQEQWDRCNSVRQYDSLVNLPDYICENSKKLKKHNQLLKLMQYLMGLDEVYAPIRIIILTTYPILDVKDDFATLSRDESHKNDKYKRPMALISEKSGSSSIPVNIADKEKKSTIKGFETNDQADYYSGITSITVNGKNAYELKGKFLDDLHKNAFSGTNGEDTSCKSDFLTEPTLCPQHIDEFDLKDETSLSEYDEVKQNVLYFNDLFPFNIIHPDDLKSDMAPLPPRDERHLWIHYQVKGYTEEIVHDFKQRHETIFERQVNRVHLLDFEGLTPDMRQDLAERLRMVYTRDDGQEEFLGGSRRSILHLKRHAKGRKSGPILSRGHFIGHLAHHFGLASDDGLRGLSVVTRELSLIDMGRLEEEIQGLRHDVRSLQGLMKRPMTDQGRFSTWMVSCMMQLMKASVRTYRHSMGPFEGVTQRSLRCFLDAGPDGASTCTAQQDEQQPDP